MGRQARQLPDPAGVSADVLSCVQFIGIQWPHEAEHLLRASVGDVQRWRDAMREQSKAPKTLNRHISSPSSFYKYLARAAAELRLPINVPNPAHAQFITGNPLIRLKAHEHLARRAHGS
jgi:Phage integrase, N-terminal SAM-like domain